MSKSKYINKKALNGLQSPYLPEKGLLYVFSYVPYQAYLILHLNHMYNRLRRLLLLKGLFKGCCNRLSTWNMPAKVSFNYTVSSKLLLGLFKASLLLLGVFYCFYDDNRYNQDCCRYLAYSFKAATLPWIQECQA